TPAARGRVRVGGCARDGITAAVGAPRGQLVAIVETSAPEFTSSKVGHVHEVSSKTYAHLFFFSSRRRHTRSTRDWSSDVCSSDLAKRSVHDRDGGNQDQSTLDPAGEILGLVVTVAMFLVGGARCDRQRPQGHCASGEVD